MRFSACLALCALVLSWTSSAVAQGDEPPVPNTAAAAEAYDRGSAFYLNGDFARAARWFETAYRLAPAAPALIQALRSQVQADHPIRAANLALRLRGLHGDVEEARALADEVIAENAPHFVWLVLECDACQLEIDARVWSYREAMIEASTEHRVRVTIDDRSEAHRVRGQPGQRIALGEPDEATPSGDPVEPIPPPQGSGGLSPWIFGVSLGLTLVSAVVLIWSGVDTLDGVDEFNRMPTIEGFEEGQARELRTNIMIGVTGGLGLITLLFAILTDWDGDPAAPSAGAWLHHGGGGAWLRGAL